MNWHPFPQASSETGQPEAGKFLSSLSSYEMAISPLVALNGDPAMCQAMLEKRGFERRCVNRRSNRAMNLVRFLLWKQTHALSFLLTLNFNFSAENE